MIIEFASQQFFTVSIIDSYVPFWIRSEYQYETLIACDCSACCWLAELRTTAGSTTSWCRGCSSPSPPSCTRTSQIRSSISSTVCTYYYMDCLMIFLLVLRLRKSKIPEPTPAIGSDRPKINSAPQRCFVPLVIFMASYLGVYSYAIFSALGFHFMDIFAS